MRTRTLSCALWFAVSVLGTGITLAAQRGGGPGGAGGAAHPAIGNREAIAEGRQLPRVHPRPTPEQHEMLKSELTKRGWTTDDFNLLSSNLAQAPPDKVCQLVSDFFAAQLSLSDPEAQTRLLVNSLRPVFVAG